MLVSPSDITLHARCRAARLVAPVVAAAALVVIASLAVAQDADREEAVGWARAGELDRAIERLRELRARYPDDVPVAADLLVILGWAGRHREALEVIDAIGVDKAPDYALFDAGRSARSLGDHDRAARYFQEGAARFPDQRRWPLALALALIDAGRLDDARPLIQALEAKAPEDREVLLAAGYFYATAKAWPDALRAYTEVLRISPDNREAQRGRVLSLETLGAPFRARELAPPGLLDDVENERVRGSEGATLVGWARLGDPDPRKRFEMADRAIDMLERQIAELRAKPDSPAWLLRRAQFDLIVAFYERKRMRDAVELYESLRREGAEVPPYALRNVASAYLYLERREVALELAREVAAKDPGNFDAQLTLFYALVDSEQYREAYALIDRLDRAQTATRRYQDGSTGDSPQKLDTAMAAALARYFGDQLGEAWERISLLAERAPTSAWIQVQAAQVARARGWPRRALDMIEPWRSAEEEDVGLELARAQTLMTLKRFEEVAPTVQRLRTEYPEDKSVQEFARDWDTTRLSQLLFKVEPNKGTEPTAPGAGLIIGMRYFTPPIADHFRLTGAYGYATADTPEGRAQLQRAAAGLEYRGPILRLFGEVTYNMTRSDHVGGRVEIEWTPDDHWVVGGSGEIFSKDTPLRALQNGITANAAGLYARYRAHESRELGLTYAFTDYSDGNRRHELTPSVSQRIVDLPRFDVTATLAGYLATNLRNNVPYFSPLFIAAPELTLTAEHIAWRRYQWALVQVLDVGVGDTIQEGFKSGVTWVAQYRHRWQLGPRLELVYGVRASSHLYDGVRQQEYAGFTRLDLRF